MPDGYLSGARRASCMPGGYSLLGELLRTPLLRSSRWRESLHSRTPIGTGAPDEGCSIVGYYAPAAGKGAEEGLGHRDGAKSEESEPLEGAL